MARFIQLTADDAAGSVLMFNVDHIVSVTPDTFNGTTRIMVPGAFFTVKESYEDVSRILHPN